MTAGQRCALAFKTGPLAGRTFSVGPGDCVFIGSGPSCTIRIADDPTVSPVHACVFYDEKSGKIRLKDMESEYGTARNGRKVRGSTVIRAGDRVTLGKLSTFHSSWWNMLQATRVTRLSAFVKRRVPSSDKNEKSTRRLSAGVLALVVALVFGGVAWWRLGPGRSAGAVSLAAKDPRIALESQRFAKSKPGDVVRAGTSALSTERRFIWDEIVSISQRFGDPPPSAMDPGFIKDVERNIRAFTMRGAHLAVLERKAKYWSLLTGILREKGLPQDLAYVVWAESGFDPAAVSPVGAAGLWQLMPDTAREYGIVVDDKRDDRRDPRKSTIAATEYLADLLRLFKGQRYLLALASYNTGQSRVQRMQLGTAVGQVGGADFWQIRAALPKETTMYVPRIMAAMIIGRNPQRWSAPAH